MNWEAIGATSELIGAFAVVSTLVYLSVQIRQNSKATEAQIYQSRSSEFSSRSRSIAESPYLSEIYSRIESVPGEFDLDAVEKLTAAETLSVRHTENQYASGFDNILQQHLLGFIPDDTLETTRRGIQRRKVLWSALGMNHLFRESLRIEMDT